MDGFSALGFENLCVKRFTLQLFYSCEDQQKRILNNSGSATTRGTVKMRVSLRVCVKIMTEFRFVLVFNALMVPFYCILV